MEARIIWVHVVGDAYVLIRGLGLYRPLFFVEEVWNLGSEKL